MSDSDIRELSKDEVSKRLVQLADGNYVERDVLNIVNKIAEYDSNLKVKYVDPNRADFGDAPYRVVEICPDGFERLVFEVWKLDETVLERIYAADTMKFDVLANIDSHNALARKRQQQRYEDKSLEAQDIVSHYLASPKGRWSFKDSETDSKITLDDQEGRQAKVERA